MSLTYQLVKVFGSVFTGEYLILLRHSEYHWEYGGYK